MAYPEPSVHDCGAPWNAIEVEDEETGEVYIICDCSRCRRMRLEAARAERMIDDYEDRKRGW